MNFVHAHVFLTEVNAEFKQCQKALRSSWDKEIQQEGRNK